jgi:hypothetical protein
VTRIIMALAICAATSGCLHLAVAGLITNAAQTHKINELSEKIERHRFLSQFQEQYWSFQ